MVLIGQSRVAEMSPPKTLRTVQHLSSICCDKLDMGPLQIYLRGVEDSKKI